MAHHILMIDTGTDEYLQFVNLVEKLEQQSKALEWFHQEENVLSADISSNYDIVLAIYNNNSRQLPAVSSGLENELLDFKNRLVSMASHEFRTPLTSIASSAELIEAYISREDFDNARRHINRIRKSIADLNLILTDFFALDKIGKGKTQVSLREVNLPGLIQDVQDDFSPLLKPGQTIKYYHKGPVLVILDPKLLKIAVSNLISNAAKFSGPGGEILITTTVSPRKIQISISDTGIGIPPEEQTWIFRRFYRARNAVNIQGTGLGLFIAKSYVELMGGAIDVFSEPEKGTTINLTFSFVA